MGQTDRGWQMLDSKHGIAWHEYWFGSGRATTFVFRGAGDGLIVMSPGSGMDDSALDALSEMGNVVALVASNAYHWLGQPAWRKRFPAARSFAPKQGVKRLAKKIPDAHFEPLDALAPLLGSGASVVEAPGLRIGNAFATVTGERGAHWYSSDFLANIPKLPSQRLIRTLMSMTDSAPGYRLFRPSVWLQVKDKPVLRAWIEDHLAKVAPAVVVPAHGAPVDGPDLVATTRALVARL
jgi:hypothetical protein